MDDRVLSWLLEDIGRFSAAVWPDKALRRYQLPPARSIVRSVVAVRWDLDGRGVLAAERQG
jgi:hypothetical protein